MKIDIFQIDAFAQELFKGNPAAVCPLKNWLPDSLMQNIALENNLSETVFFVKQGNEYQIRWFTPLVEVALCGHATLAAAYVIFEKFENKSDKIVFSSKSGRLEVKRDQSGRLTLNFPSNSVTKIPVPSNLEGALGTKVLKTYHSEVDLLALVKSQEEVESLNPNMELLKTIKARGIIVSSKGNNVDFVSRFFGPQSGVNEDPVTGSAHTILAPFWAKVLGKNKLIAQQLSKRGGKLDCEVLGDRVNISGRAKLFMQGEIFLE